MDNTTLVCSRIRAASTLLERVVAKEEGDLVAGDSAFCALTDFEMDFPIAADSETPTVDASRDMSRLGIHALLVTRRSLRGMDPQLIGLVTAREIDRAHGYSRAYTRGQKRAALRVQDVMTPWDQLSCVKYESLRCLTAIDLYEMFQGTGLSHLLVVDLQKNEVAVARGVLSRATIARRLGKFRGLPTGTRGAAPHSLPPANRAD